MALSELPQHEPGPDQGYTEAAQHQHKSKANPAAAPPIEVARAHHPAANPAASTPAITDQKQVNHVGVVARNSLAVEPTAATASYPLHGDEMWQRPLKRLPRGSRPVTFVGEGAANAVFEIKVPQNGLPNQSFKGLCLFQASPASRHEEIQADEVHAGLLLRVAKVPALGQPTAYNYHFQQEFYQTAICPLLGNKVIHQELVILRNSGIIDELNRLLQDLDHSRKAKFRGSFVGQSDWGLLIEDMRPDIKAPAQRVLVEFKPKWLSQSRSAPARAVRCRQCALELQRKLTKPVTGTGPFAPERKPCPLALVAEEPPPPAVSSPFRIAPQLIDSPEREHLQTSLEHILHGPFLDDLRALQIELDTTGPLRATPKDDNFGIAMTIRDCTCFALLPKDAAARKAEDIKIRLGDLDWKDPRTKIQHWRGTEQALIDGGFYTADWILCDGVYYYPPTLCLLEWKPRLSSTGATDVIQLQDADSDQPTNGYTAKRHVFTHVADTAQLRAKLQPYNAGDRVPANPHRPLPY
ncbi:hypothetical protein LLEC1_07321 [Akanthomyces lecanii]|uniref:Inositol-pentakisphosphate 2-kinase n=1 Tax=Cordyceps confragosa TaxID=2714763 RepID=A0A179IGZ0_CORDF|nr:hypothetical protein LLEC1_07321 [Akanthomyces lecanii]